MANAKSKALIYDPLTKKNVPRKPLKQQMGGTTSHNGKPDTDAMIKKSQAHHEANRRRMGY